MTFIETEHLSLKRPRKFNELDKMAELTFNSVFQEITCTFKDEPFSTMYYGRHCGKNLLILKHHLSIILAFGDDFQWSKPDLIKSVTIRGESVRGIKIVGNEDVILMLDESGSLWKLINTFDFSYEKFESLHLLTDECFYEWVPFKKLNCQKVLAVCATKQGFACIELFEKSEKKLAVLSSINLPVEEFTFDGLNSTYSFNYYLNYFEIDLENSALKNKLDNTKEIFLVTDRLKGKTYLCSRKGKNCLINESNLYLVSALHFNQEKCVTLCFESGKLVFYFYNEPERQYVVYLPRKLSIVEKCCCFDSCLLWSDGINLHHTKFTAASAHLPVKATHLKLSCVVQSPLSLMPIHQCILTTTINNIYYMISASSVHGTQIKRNPRELLNNINESSLNIDELEQKIEMLSHYLYCKDIIESCNIKEKIKIKWEGNSLIIKSLLRIHLKHEFWKLRLKMEAQEKEIVHMVEFNFDLSEGMCIRTDNPFKSKDKIEVSLIGNFSGVGLFLYLGEVGKPENNFKKNSLSKGLKHILSKKNPAYYKE